MILLSHKIYRKAFLGKLSSFCVYKFGIFFLFNLFCDLSKMSKIETKVYFFYVDSVCDYDSLKTCVAFIEVHESSCVVAAAV